MVNDKLNLKKIGSNVRYIREKRDYKVKEFSDYLGITPSHIRNFENGEKGVSLLTMKNISDCLSIPIDDLLNKNLGLDADEGLRLGVAEKGNAPPTAKSKREKLISLLSHLDDVEIELVLNIVKPLLGYFRVSTSIKTDMLDPEADDSEDLEDGN